MVTPFLASKGYFLDNVSMFSGEGEEFDYQIMPVNIVLMFSRARKLMCIWVWVSAYFDTARNQQARPTFLHKVSRSQLSCVVGPRITCLA